MPNFNRVILAGHLTRDPELRYTPGGTSVCAFGLATNRKWTGKDGKETEEKLFIDCAAFGKPGDVIAEYMAKGRALLVEGRLKLDQWDDKNGGGKRSKISVIVESF